MNKTYNIYRSQTALDELSNILAYPPDVKERIFMDAYNRLSFMPTLTAKQINNWDFKRLLGKTWVISSNSYI